MTAVLAVFSCTKSYEQEEWNSFPIFRSSIEDRPLTRTYLDSDHKLLWSEDDRISVFTSTDNQQYRFKGKTGDFGGEFERVSPQVLSGSSLQANYALYPYDASASISTSGAISLSIPSVQPYREGGFAPGVNPMVAVTEDSSDDFFSFRNLCGFVVLRLYGKSTVTGIVLKGNNGEKISGAASVKPEFGKAPEIEMSSSAGETVSIDCGGGIEIGRMESESTEFWFCVPPVAFSKGFTVEITDISGESITKSMSLPRIVSRNLINTLSPFKVRVADPSAPKAVDLGLSVKWAEFNVGATKPQEYGNYYAWGELESSTNAWNTYKWRKSGTDWDTVKLSKYNTDPSFGEVDGKNELEADDDIASETYGGAWRMPSDSEWKELVTNCSWTWTTVGGVQGYNVSSNIEGYESASIFLPAAGYRYENTLYAAGSEGGYWSSSLYSGITSYAWAMNFGSDMIMRYYISRCYGHSVRAVIE